MIINGKMAKFAITNIHLQMIKQKQIAVLGSTGSIGTQTLDIINEYPDKFRASVLVAGSNVELLIEQAQKHCPDMAVIADERKYSALNSALKPLGIKVAAGANAVADVMELETIDTVVTDRKSVV